ncbi:Hypothetical predicted protein [Pelobates cultripes]|uniref:Uncharacterized protein n=1 Tax=Pelobates cultripes TaxID=61616 RepID=A0AAD1VMB6_PELCU|nr:Hypothetical predicted protein [Pelobates cultripes]
MRPLSDGPSCLTSEDSLTNLRGSEQPVTKRRAEQPPMQRVSPLVTEAMLKAYFHELCQSITASIAAFKKEINGVSVRLHDTEVTSAAHEVRIASLETEIATLRQEITQSQHHMAVMEDRRRWKNVKLSGLPGSIPLTEIPHLIRI